MPATVLITESTRRTVRALLVIAAVVAVLIPLGIVTAQGASRLDYTRVDASETLPRGIEQLRLDLDTSAQVTVSTSDDASPDVTVTGVGPRAQSPSLDVRSTGVTTTVSVAENGELENSQVRITLPAADSKALSLQVSGGTGTVDIDGDFKDITTSSEAASVDIRGSAERLTATTDWGAVSLSGTYDSVVARSQSGDLGSHDLTAKDSVDVSAETGHIDLGLSNDSVPLAGITATTQDGDISVSLPRLEMIRRRAATAATSPTDTSSAAAEGKDSAKDTTTAPTTDDANDSATSAKDLFYQINATSTEGTVDLARSLSHYDVAKKPDLTGKTVVPITLTTNTGTVTISN